MNTLPTTVCVKAKYLRPRYDNLEEWYAQPGNVLVTRHGRVFITSVQGKHIFHYKASEWANPFTLKEYSLEQSLELYENHLDTLLIDSDTRKRFMKLKNAKEIGCFCDPESKCHRNVILKKLKDIQEM